MSTTLDWSDVMTDENGTVPSTPIEPSINKCNYFINSANQTVVFEFANPFGGIPQNLAINAIFFVILFIVFAILRRTAGNYGRLVSQSLPLEFY
jgi:hypothetical protein